MDHQQSELTKEIAKTFNKLCKKYDNEEVALELARFATCLIIALAKANKNENMVTNVANNIANTLEGNRK